MIKVSVIIPVYNVEPYLKEALDSVINQTLREIEIICIDDCSTDNSYNILEEYAKKDNRIIIIKNENNMGVGYSRNVGEKLAKGEYIHFMDPDDCISLNFYECMYNTGKKYNSDIINTANVIDCNLTLDNIIIDRTNFLILDKDYNLDVSIKNMYDYSNYNEMTYPTLWCKLFKKEFLIENNLFSTENKIGASYDSDLILKTFLYYPKCSFNNNSVYYYRIRNGSIIDKLKNNIDRIKNIIINYSNTIELFKVSRIDILNELYIFIFGSIIEHFEKSSIEFINDNYLILKKFVEKIYIDEKYLNKNIDFETEKYNKYILIKSSEDYGKYLLNKTIFDNLKYLDYEICHLKENIKKSDNWFRLFGINNSKDCLIIIVFGIKISIKKKNDKDI